MLARTGRSDQHSPARLRALWARMVSHGIVEYGGYEVRSLSARSGIPVRVDAQPAFGVGKYTTAADLATV